MTTPLPPTFRVIHTVRSLRADHGGPGRSITALCTALARDDYKVDLVAIGHREGEEPPILPQSTAVQMHLLNDESSLIEILCGRDGYSQVVSSIVASAGS